MSTTNKTDRTFDLEQWSQSRPADFDLEAQYQERVLPLLDALMAECIALKLPAMFTAAYQQDGRSTGYATRSHLPSMDRTPPGLLLTLFATRNDQEAMDAVLTANAVRVCMTAITQH